MTARCVHFAMNGGRAGTAARATVVLDPSWFGRMFGARPRSVDLYNSNAGWCAVATGRDLDHLPHGSLIRNALDFREVGSPARWTLASGAEAVAP